MQNAFLIELQSFPPIEFFIRGMAVESIYLEAQENYRKGSYRNRYMIAGPNGIQRLSIPLKGGKHQQLGIRKVQIDHSGSWAKEHWRAVKTAYGRSPFFIHYESEIEALFTDPVEHLWDWNKKVLHCCLNLTGVNLNLQDTQTFEKQPADHIEDLRNKLLPKYQNVNNFQNFKYAQVFEDRHGFLPNLSILDLLFCQGPQATISLSRATT